MKLKDPFSGLSHAFGAVLSVAALVILLVLSHNDPWRITSFAVYGATLILLYAASALYHSLRVSERAESVFYSLDRAGIYLLIAGTYTPICLVALKGGWGWSLFGVIWGLALFGIILDAVTKRRVPNWVQAVLYIAMGWVFLVAIVPLIKILSLASLIWLTLGCVIYTAGGALCVRHPKPHPTKLFHYHDLWHVLVIAASACHFVLMVLLATA
jgi:hemolysin III